MVNLQQLQNAQHNVIDIAEAGCLSFLGVMHATCVKDACISLSNNSSSALSEQHMSREI